MSHPANVPRVRFVADQGHHGLGFLALKPRSAVAAAACASGESWGIWIGSSDLYARATILPVCTARRSGLVASAR